jgi:hypothetical protein
MASLLGLMTGGVAIGALLPAVLARLDIKTTKENENRDRS